MLEAEVKDTLSEIEDITISTVAPFMTATFDTNIIKYGYKQFDSYECRTTYLMFMLKDRVLYYGINSPKKEFAFPMLEGEEDLGTIQMQFDPYIFTKKGVLSQSDIKKTFLKNSDEEMELLESVGPLDDETDEEFFLRNAMWLLSPVVN